MMARLVTKEGQTHILNLSNRGLVSLPQEIGERLDLEAIDLDENAITSLPDFIGQLVR